MAEKIVVSLTSIKSRENALKETLISLLNQKFDRPYEIRVYLSHEPYLLDDGFDREPHWISEISQSHANCKLKVFFVRNTGPYRKLLPVLKDCFNAPFGTIIITCDDDTYYEQNWLSTLLECHYKIGGIVAFRGHTISIEENSDNLPPYREWQLNKKKKHYCLSNLPTGKDGIVYRPYYFRPEVLDVDRAILMAPTADDLWFRWHTITNGVPCYLIKLTGKVFKDVPSFSEEVSLWEEYNKNGGNDITVGKLEDYSYSTFKLNVKTVLEKFYSNEKIIIPSGNKNTDLIGMAAQQIHSSSTIKGCSNEFKVLSARSYELIRYCLRNK